MATKRPAPKSAFKPGQSGNPRGKPAGTRSKSTQLLEALMQSGAEAITHVVIQQAKDGDLMACKIILDRLIPPAKERPISLSLPPCTDAAGVLNAQSVILRAVGQGQLLPGEGQMLSSIVESKRKTIEIQDLADRIEKLESDRGNA